MKRKEQWKRLDNAAKIFPTTSNAADPKVFRFSCEMTEEVCGPQLQKALDKTLERFPHYRQVLRKGLFWHYFEDSSLTPVVREEYKPPCSTLYDKDNIGLLFEVTYYKKRINLEVFHALSDGTGALQFLRTLAVNYISEHYGREDISQISLDYDASVMQRESDSFAKYYKKMKIKRTKSPKAFCLKGERLPENRLCVIEGRTSVRDMLDFARKSECTVTELMTAVLICSIHDVMPLRYEERPVVITIPVNLRKYFPSESSRNFFCVVNIAHNFKNGGKTFEEVLAHVKKEFKQKLAYEQIEKKMNQFSALEHNLAVQIVPLFLKIPVLKIANYINSKKATAAISNVGVVKMPQETQNYLNAFEVCYSTNCFQACVCSYMDTMSICFTTHLISTDVQRGFFRTLARLGMKISVFSNLEDEENEM